MLAVRPAVETLHGWLPHTLQQPDAHSMTVSHDIIACVRQNTCKQATVAKTVHHEHMLSDVWVHSWHIPLCVRQVFH